MKRLSKRSKKAQVSLIGIVVVFIIIAVLSLYELKSSSPTSKNSPQSQVTVASNAAAVSAATSMAQDAIAIARTQGALDPGAPSIIATAMSETGIATYSPAGSTGSGTRYQIQYDGGSACVTIPSDSSPATTTAGSCV